jgi:MoxR-like ATPase
MTDELSIKEISTIYQSLRYEIQTAISGLDEAIDHALIALFTGGHVLFEGVPGLGKTLLARALSSVIGSPFKRVQFTPDLMPADIIGTTIFNTEKNSFQIKKGPIFTSVLLADEINRSPAKTQSALLQAMQERNVTIDGQPFHLPDNFICLATQNPIEMEGTYPLPEAQVDRFLMKITLDYPGHEEEKQILHRYRDGVLSDTLDISLDQKISEEVLSGIKKALRKIIVDESIIEYITKIVRATREHHAIETGSSPRASVALFLASRAKAAAEGRDFVIPDDVKSLGPAILRHRVILKAEAEIEGYTPDFYVGKILESVEVPR